MKGTRPKTQVAMVFGVMLALVAAACSTKKANEGPATTGVAKGGVYRTATTSFGFIGGFDPVGEYTAVGFDYYQALLRNLVSYKHIGGAPGNIIYPDLATSLGDVSSDGLTYTYHLKDNIKFAPPVSRDITSADIKYAFERIDSKALVAQYGYYYDGVVAGMAVHGGPPADISGIETPDPKTIVFHLTAPTSDFPARLSLAATSPVPQEVAKCFTQAGGYGRDVVSSGPYMIQGADKVDASSCDSLTPMAGFDPTKQLTLVRNPTYVQSTDNLRSNYVDAISVSIDANVNDIFDRISSGSLDGSFYEIPPPTVLQNYQTDASLTKYLHIDSQDTTYYLTMDLVVPPFDDIHVRKAVNLITDKAALLKAWGGVAAGTLATHIMPPGMAGLDASYDPYASPGETGDLAKAQAEMKLSKYDPKQDGLCDVDACKNLIMINRNVPPWTTAEPSVVAALAKIGIDVKARELESGAAYQTIDTIKNNIPIAMNARWGKDYADPNAFAQPLFASASIIPVGTSNYSLVGLTQDQATKFGLKYPAGGVPSADSQMAACPNVAGAARNTCFAGVDKYLMESVVPWVPLFWANQVTVTSPSVTRYEFDQFTGFISLVQIAVNNKATV